MEKASVLRESLGSSLREHEVMRDHTTIHVGGVADFYFEAKTIDEVKLAVELASKLKIAYVVLGNGSNVVFSDFGFPGLVIRNLTNNIAFMMEKNQVIVDGGVHLQKLILESVSHNLSGLEFLFGIPGTVGGAIYGNAGAYGQAIGDYVKSVTLLLPGEKPEIVQYDSNWLEFGYRSTKLKKLEGYDKPVILSAKIQLAQSRQEEIMRRLNKWKEERLSRQPDGFSSGSFFKNPIPAGLENITGSGRKSMPILPKERTAGFMLEKAGAKKLKVGGAKVATKHANYILNVENAKAEDIRILAEQMRQIVKDRFDVNLQEEVEYLGQW